MRVEAVFDGQPLTIIVAVGLALIFATFIPNKPHSIRWLTPTEKDQLEYRLEVDRAIKDATDEVGVGRALVMALSDVSPSKRDLDESSDTSFPSPRLGYSEVYCR